MPSDAHSKCSCRDRKIAKLGSNNRDVTASDVHSGPYLQMDGWF
jgi:hypothetical protein